MSDSELTSGEDEGAEAVRASLLDRCEGLLRGGRWLALVALLILLAVLGHRATFRHNAGTRGDTRFYQRGAQRFWEGLPLYHFQPAIESEPTAPRATTAYTYLPPFAAFLGWSVPLPYRVLRGLWLLVSCLALVAGLRVVRRLASAPRPAGQASKESEDPAEPDASEAGSGATDRVLPRQLGMREPAQERPWLWLALLGLLAGRFVVNDLSHGQVNAFLALLLALGIRDVYGWGSSQPRPLRGGAWIGLALVIKPTSWLLLPWLLFDRRWRALGAATAVGAGALLACWPLYGGDYVGEIEDWFRLMPSFANAESARPYNASLAGTLQRLFSGSLPSGALQPERLLASWDVARVQPLARVSACFAVLAGLACVVWRRRRDLISSPRAAASVLLLSALLSPITWKAHFVVLLLPLGFVAADLARGQASRLRWALALIVVNLFLLPSRGLGALGSALEAWGGLSLGLVLMFLLCACPPPLRGEGNRS